MMLPAYPQLLPVHLNDGMYSTTDMLHIDLGLDCDRGVDAVSKTTIRKRPRYDDARPTPLAFSSS
jgi:hypothetical protein